MQHFRRQCRSPSSLDAQRRRRCHRRASSMRGAATRRLPAWRPSRSAPGSPPPAAACPGCPRCARAASADQASTATRAERSWCSSSVSVSRTTAFRSSRAKTAAGARKIQQAVDDLGRAERLLRNLLQHGRQPLVLRGSCCLLAASACRRNHRKRRVHFVRHACGQQADRRQLFRLRQAALPAASGRSCRPRSRCEPTETKSRFSSGAMA